MNDETATGGEHITLPRAMAVPNDAERWPSTRLQKILSPHYVTVFLIASILLAEIFERLLSFRLRPYLSATESVFFEAFCMLIVIVPSFYFFVYRPMTRHHRERLASEAEIKFLSRQLLLLGDQEKRAVVRDLHDYFRQPLGELQASMKNLKTAVDSDSAQATLVEPLAATITQLEDLVSAVSTGLSPFQLDDLGLESVLEWAVMDIQSKGGRVSVDFDSCNMADRLTYDVEITLYRIFQESMANIIQHSEASRVAISLTGTASHVGLSIKDNGAGFDPSTECRKDCCRGIGLLGMRERAEALGGEFSLRSALGKGTFIEVRVPRTLRLAENNCQ